MINYFILFQKLYYYLNFIHFLIKYTQDLFILNKQF